MNKKNMEKTAVEWQHIELSKFIYGKSEYKDANDILKKAKEMEKHQTLVFGIKCQMDYIKYDFHRNIEDIYNEKYGGKL
jgi:RNase H-fold protein (predicted Holliday junction resolvase)